MRLALDTETSGLSLLHGCRPFFVSTCDEIGNTDANWEWDICPKTRNALVTKKQVKQIDEIVNDAECVILHNAKFDLHALQLIGVRLPPWEKIHDTLAMSHVLDSAEPHGLKPLAAKYCEFPISDEQDLQKACVKARHLAGKIGWAIAGPTHPHFKPASKSGGKKNSWPKSDMWLPRQYAIHSRTSTPELYKTLTDEEFSRWLGVCRKYAIGDAVRTMLLYDVFKEWLAEDKLEKVYRMQRAALAPLYAIEKNGFPILPKQLAVQTKLMEEKRAKQETTANKIAERATKQKFNIRSHAKIKNLLYKTWGLPIIKRTKPSKSAPKGNPSSDFETMLRLAFGEYPEAKKPEIKEFLQAYCQYSKFNTATTYLRSYDANRIKRRLYATANNQGTATTRVSFSDPNLQNIGKGGAALGIDDYEIQLFLDALGAENKSLRSVFGPLPGTYWYDLDYSQLQLRIFAFVANEQELIEAFARGWDAHTFVARKIFRLRDDQEPTKLQRRIAKNVNFGFVFGASPRKIEATAGVPGLWDTVISIFPNAHKFMQSVKKQVRNHGHVTTPGGYRLMCDQEHKGVNYIVQGAEGEIVKRAMINTYRYTLQQQRLGKDQFRLLLQVHDELIFQDQAEPFKTKIVDKGDGKTDTLITLRNSRYVQGVRGIMEEAGAYYGMSTPVDAELVTDNWSKSYKIILPPVTAA